MGKANDRSESDEDLDLFESGEDVDSDLELLDESLGMRRRK